MPFSSFLSLFLIALLMVGPAPAQNLANAAALVITIVNNDGGVSAPGARAQKGFTLQISDNSGAPVADAAVVLRFPDSGPTATFTDGTHAGIAYTDATGRAEVSGMQWSAESGTVPIKVTATKGTAHAGIIIEEQLSAEAPGSTVHTPTPSKDVPVTAASSQPNKTETDTMPVERTQPERASAEERVRPGVSRTMDHIPAPVSAASSVPSISVINRPSNEKLDTGGSHKKWIILLIAVAAGAGAGIALAGKKSSSSSSTSGSTSTGTTIGSPTVNVGAP